jgi:hypothetical protein
LIVYKAAEGAARVIEEVWKKRHGVKKECDLHRGRIPYDREGSSGSENPQVGKDRRVGACLSPCGWMISARSALAFKQGGFTIDSVKVGEPGKLLHIAPRLPGAAFSSPVP